MWALPNPSLLKLYFILSQEVFTHDSKCEMGSIDEHDHASAMEDNMIPLAPPRADSPIIDIDFYPDWSANSTQCWPYCQAVGDCVFIHCSDNETMYEMFKDREMSNCHLEIYQVCQEGHQLVQYVELDFEEG